MTKLKNLHSKAIEIVNRIFYTLLANNDKQEWRKGLNFIDNKLMKLKMWERWEEMFIWEQVKREMNKRYWKKFDIWKK